MEHITIPKQFAANSLMNDEQYRKWYQDSLDSPEAFWREQGKRIDWIKPYNKVLDVSYQGDVSIKWFYDGTLNVAANCLDRHLKTKGDKVAIIWEGDNPDETLKVTYRQLYEQVCRLANAMETLGVKKGDRVTIYLPMIVEAVVAMLACARIGAVHSVVFAGFSPEILLAGRIEGCRIHY